MHPLPRGVYRWQSILGREVHNSLQIKHVEIALKDDHRLGMLAERSGKCPLIVVGLSYFQELQLDAQHSGGALHGFPTLPAKALTREGSHARAARHRLLQDLQSLLVEIRGHGGEPCDVRARMREAGNVS